MTEAEKEKQSLKFALRAEDMLVDCVRSLYEDRGIGDTLTVILDKLGRFMNADQSYVFMLRDGKLYNEYEVVRRGCGIPDGYTAGPASGIHRPVA